MTDARRNLLWNVWVQLGLVAAIVVLANVLAVRHFWRLDLTQDRLYSLDEASKNLVGTLDRPLVAKVYFTRGLEAPYNNHEQLVRDKLEELRAYAGGRMKIQVVDPATDPELVKEAQKYGLTQLESTVREADRKELRKIWMGAVLLYGDKQEVLPALTELSSLEYELASAIHRLKTKAEDGPVLAYTVGNGEPDLGRPEGPLTSLVGAIARRFVLQPVQLGGAGTIPEEVDALLVIGPQRPLPDRALYQIDQFVMRGGAVAFFVTGTRPDLRTFRPQRVGSGLEPLVGHYGVRVAKDVVLDRVQNGLMRFPVRQGRQTGYREINYPLIPRATDLSRTNPLVAGLDSLLFPFTSSLSVAEQLPPGVAAEVLARSSASSGSLQGLRTVDPTQFAEIAPDEKRGPFPVLVALTGAQRSFFETRPPPRPDPDAPPVVESETEPEEAPLLVEGGPTRLLVAGSADFVANNPAFMLNLADWLVEDEALIGIRSKIATIPQLRATTANERTGWRLFNLLAGPALLLAFGGARQLWFRRRAQRASDRRAA
ncbi:MAG: GldG family protein [Myxococcota bacterium]